MALAVGRGDLHVPLGLRAACGPEFEACIQQARALGVTGWVRNHIDGSVEAILQGSAEQLDRMCDWMGEGMTDALVDKLEVVDLPPPFARFGEFKLATAI